VFLPHYETSNYPLSVFVFYTVKRARTVPKAIITLLFGDGGGVSILLVVLVVDVDLHSLSNVNI